MNEWANEWNGWLIYNFSTFSISNRGRVPNTLLFTVVNTFVWYSFKSVPACLALDSFNQCERYTPSDVSWITLPRLRWFTYTSGWVNSVRVEYVTKMVLATPMTAANGAIYYTIPYPYIILLSHIRMYIMMLDGWWLIDEMIDDIQQRMIRQTWHDIALVWPLIDVAWLRQGGDRWVSKLLYHKQT